ncbi:hypothetical protein K1719_012906 [Acacia pycnantha]|nr:hypothetical protein K1719_012906 [Acacia pycnantha]
MGKYLKKSKIAADIVVMGLSPQSSLGVRTRAKTLALQKLQKSSLFSTPDLDASSSYLQLRSRRLEKIVLGTETRPALLQKKSFRERPKGNFCDVILNSVVDEKEGLCSGVFGKETQAEELENNDVDFEGSYGENLLEAEGRDRSTRESTPCSLVRESNAIGTPGSTTRQRASSITNQIICQRIQRNIPTSYEMDEFFAYAEKQQQVIFMDKYNFDIVSDVPLPGRYEWVQV